jgi:hypothetical protein
LKIKIRKGLSNFKMCKNYQIPPDLVVNFQTVDIVEVI